MRAVIAFGSILAMGLMVNSETPSLARDYIARGGFFAAILRLTDDHKFVLTIADHNIEAPRKHYEESGTWELHDGAGLGNATLQLDTNQVRRFRIKDNYFISETLASKTGISRRLPFVQTESGGIVVRFPHLKQKYELQNSCSESGWLKFEMVESGNLWQFVYAKDHKTHTF